MGADSARCEAGPAPAADNAAMKTPARLQSLVEEGLIDAVLRQLMSGKEANVYVVRCGEHLRAAADDPDRRVEPLERFLLNDGRERLAEAARLRIFVDDEHAAGVTGDRE